MSIDSEWRRWPYKYISYIHIYVCVCIYLYASSVPRFLRDHTRIVPRTFVISWNWASIRVFIYDHSIIIAMMIALDKFDRYYFIIIIPWCAHSHTWWRYDGKIEFSLRNCLLCDVCALSGIGMCHLRDGENVDKMKMPLV